MNGAFSFFSSHLEELRKRLIIAFLSIVIFSGAAYLCIEPIIRLLMIPILTAVRPAPLKLVYTALTEAFITYLKVALLVGLFFSLPVILYELWRFVAPGLHRHERTKALRVVMAATALFAAGAGFAYFIVLPQALTFFMGFSSAQLEALPKLSNYLTLVARTILTCGLAFEIPFLMLAARKTGLVGAEYFQQKRKFFYPVILILSFLLTAGNLFAAVLLALPLCGLYEAGIIINRLFAGSGKR